MNGKTIVVCGATGKQGGAVVQSLLNSQKWNVVALSRNPSGEPAQALRSKKIELKKADLQDKASLVQAFENAYGVFGVTQPLSPDSKKNDNAAGIEQGRNIVNACLQTGVKHLVLSTMLHWGTGKTGMPYVDSKVEIKEKARELVKNAATQKEAALSIFYFVRDSIRFALDFTDFKASHALKTRLGFCVHKPNLQIALLRAVGIPARSHRVGVKKESLQGIVPDPVYKAFPDAFNHHTWCECYLSGKWISCEALFDKGLFDGMREKRVTVANQIPTIDWDGENDLIVVKPWVVKDFGTFASLDDFWREIAKQLGSRLPSAAISSSNQYTDSLRKR